jgi:L-fuculose-phosphate aldolase
MKTNDVLNNLVETARELSTTGLVVGAGGNVSARDEEKMWISPSGFSFADAEAGHYPSVDIASGEILSGNHRPSSEVLMHLAIYRIRPEVNAVIHTHPKTLVALTAAGHDLKAMYADYHVYLGSHVPHLPYITVTTPELADAVEKEYRDSRCVGVVLRNHGAITVGESIREAVFRTQAMDEQSLIQWQALQVGTPTFLSDDECGKLDMLGSEDYRRELLAKMKR